MIRLKNYIENQINTNLKESITYKKDDSFYNYCCDSGNRLLNAWGMYKYNENYKIDFEITLRDFLLLIKTGIIIKGYRTSEFGKKNLNLYNNGEEIAVNPNYPIYINNSYVASCNNKNENAEIKLNKECLNVNGYIKRLTNGKFNEYKSIEQKISLIGALKTPKGFTSLISMPTGGGKSLITQAISYIEEGLTIVIVPTISLMIDQVKNAKEIINPQNDNEIILYNSYSNLEEVVTILNSHVVKVLFISPEALIKNNKLREAIESLNKEGCLKNIIIDEAHIIEEWGSSFRLDFQCLDILRRHLMQENKNLKTFLLSATYSRRTVQLLKESFSEKDNWIEIRCDALRKEIRYCILKTDRYSKLERSIELIIKLPHPMIVYVQNPEEAERLKLELKNNGINNVKTFTGKTVNTKREELIKEWTSNKFGIMIATCAFGVGVDKKDVRTIIHLYVSDNPNKFYQEAGRCGRDGLHSLSVILYSEEDINAAFGLVTKTLTTEKLQGRWFSMLNSSSSKKEGNNKVIIDTSVKPNYYSKDELIIDLINDKDISWNVYVILLMKRYNLINIDWVVYDVGKYIFSLTIKEPSLFNEGENSLNVLAKIRDDEESHIIQEFNYMKNMLNKSKKICISETFCKIYNLVDEYCLGCNCHSDIIKLNIDNSYLKKKINYIEKDYGKKISLFENKNFALIKYQNYEKIINLLLDKVDCYVFSNLLDDVVLDRNTMTNYFSMDELFYLSENAPFILGSIIMIDLKNDEKIILKVLKNCIKLKNLFNFHFIYLIKEDFYIRSKERKLSELIECQIFQEYILSEVLKDV